MRKYKFLKNFTETFNGINEKLQRDVFVGPVRVWPPVTKSPSCIDGKPYKYRGMGVTHKDLLQEFFWDRSETSCDILMIFEDDALGTHPDTIKLAMQEVLAQKTDFHFMGYCYRVIEGNPLDTNFPPLCAHAHAVTVQGAFKLYNLLRSCHKERAGDKQIQELLLEKRLTWSVSPFRLDKDSRKYLSDRLYDWKAYLSPPLHFDGLFVQAKPEPDVSDLADYTAAYIKPSKQIYVLFERHWHAVGSMDTFFNLGLDVEKVMSLSVSQFDTFPKGDIIDDALFKRMKEKKKSKQ